MLGWLETLRRHLRLRLLQVLRHRLCPAAASLGHMQAGQGYESLRQSLEYRYVKA